MTNYWSPEFRGSVGGLVYKGVIDASGNPNYPAAVSGDVYVISVAGKIGGASGVNVEAGDLVLAKNDNAGGTQAAVGSSWDIVQQSGTSVSGPVSSTDNAVARFDGVTGKLIQDSVVLVSDLGVVTGITDLTSSGRQAFGNTAVIGGSTTFESLLAFENTITDFSASLLWSPFTNYVTVNPSANIATTQIFASDIEANVFLGNNKNIERVQAEYSQATHAGTGTLSLLVGKELYAWTTSSGPISNLWCASYASWIETGSTSVVTDNYCLQLKSGNSGAAGASITEDITCLIKTPYHTQTMTTHVGLDIQDQEYGTTSFSIRTGTGLVSFGDDVKGISRVAFGSTATFGAVSTETKQWHFSEITTDFTSATSFDGMRINYVVDPTVDLTGGNAKYIYANIGSVSIPNTNTHAVELIEAINYNALHSGSGKATSVAGGVFGGSVNGSGGAAQILGLQGSASNNGASSTADAVYGGYFSSGAGGATSINTLDYTVFVATPSHTGTLTSHYGVYIQDQSFGATAYSIFSESGNAEISSATGKTSNFILSSFDVAQPVTSLAAAKTFGLFAPTSGTAGGLTISGFTDTDAQPLFIKGIFGTTNPTDATPAIKLAGFKSDGGTGVTAVGAAETVYQLLNNTTSILTILGDGTSSLTGSLAVSSTFSTTGRLKRSLGANVAAANDLTLGTDGNVYTITGNTQINAITTANWGNGNDIILKFTGTPTVKHNTAGGAGTATILLSGSADLLCANNTMLGLVYDGTNWQETFRKAA